MFHLSNNSIIYILAPAYSASGGQEALHQLCYYLTLKSYRAKIAYYFCNDKTKNPTAPVYAKYKVDYCFADDIQDVPANLVICPEIATGFLRDFTNIHKAIWWLSVGFYLSDKKNNSFPKLLSNVLRGRLGKALEIVRQSRRIFNFNNASIRHLTGSHYAYDFVTKHGATNVRLFIEPLGIDFINNVINGPAIDFNGLKRQDRVLYNPAKKSRTMRRFMETYPSYTYVPLQGLTPDQLIETMKTSKVYIDLGKFPGPERLPKEASVCGCCIITGQRGAAKFYQDVRIPDEFKIKKYSLSAIKEKLDMLLTEYDAQIAKFCEYRLMIKDLEKNFNKQIDDIFQYGNR
jgi:hypothetical protein